MHYPKHSGELCDTYQRYILENILHQASFELQRGKGSYYSMFGVDEENTFLVKSLYLVVHIINAKILQHSKTRDTSLVHITGALFSKVLACDFTSATLLGTLCCAIPSLPLCIHLKQFLPPGHSTSHVHFSSPVLSGRIPMPASLLCKGILRIRTFPSPAQCVWPLADLCIPTDTTSHPTLWNFKS